MNTTREAIAEALREEWPNTFDEDFAGAVADTAAEAAEARNTTMATPELDDLYQACKQIEDSDGGWNGGDVVDIVCSLLTRHGYDLDAAPEGEQ